jgi:hypothetical protein
MDMFEAPMSRRDLFVQALGEHSPLKLRMGYTWHIGNTKFYDSFQGYFRVGRTTKTTVEIYDNQTGNFVEATMDASPCTHVVFDAELGICVIAKRSTLKESSKSIADKIARILNGTSTATSSRVTIEIGPVPDPKGFIHELESARRITRFTATFHRPNPFDADELFQRPLAVLLQGAGGDKGKAQIQGERLNAETLAEIARSTAATANDASARVIRKNSNKPVTVHLSGDPIKKRYDLAGHDPQFVLRDFIEIYHRIRDHGTEANQ